MVLPRRTWITKKAWSVIIKSDNRRDYGKSTQISDAIDKKHTRRHKHGNRAICSQPITTTTKSIISIKYFFHLSLDLQKTFNVVPLPLKKTIWILSSKKLLFKKLKISRYLSNLVIIDTVFLFYSAQRNASRCKSYSYNSNKRYNLKKTNTTSFYQCGMLAAICYNDRSICSTPQGHHKSFPYCTKTVYTQQRRNTISHFVFSQHNQVRSASVTVRTQEGAKLDTESHLATWRIELKGGG